MTPKVRAVGRQMYIVWGVRRPMASLNPHMAPAPPNTSSTRRAEKIWRRRIHGEAVATDLVRCICDSSLYRESRRGMISLDDFERLAAEFNPLFFAPGLRSDHVAIVVMEMARRNLLAGYDELNAVKLCERTSGESLTITEADVAIYR